MEFVTVILEFVKNLLAFLNEGEAAGIVEIVKGFIAAFQGGGAEGVLATVKELLAFLNEGEAAGIIEMVKEFIANIPALL